MSRPQQKNQTSFWKPSLQSRADRKKAGLVGPASGNAVTSQRGQVQGASVHLSNQPKISAHSESKETLILEKRNSGTNQAHLGALEVICKRMKKNGLKAPGKLSIPGDRVEVQIFAHSRCRHNSRRPSIDFNIVISSAYSISLPTGMPMAIRVTLRPARRNFPER